MNAWIATKDPANVDAAADRDKALAITLNAKTHRPSVCNAAESLLVHRDLAADFLPEVLRVLAEAGVVLHGDEATRELAPEGVTVEPATDEDFDTEYLALEMSVAVVDDLDAADRAVAGQRECRPVRTVGAGVGAVRCWSSFHAIDRWC